MAGTFSEAVGIARRIHDEIDLHDPNHGATHGKGGALVIKVLPDLQNYVQTALRAEDPNYTVEYTNAVHHPFVTVY